VAKISDAIKTINLKDHDESNTIDYDKNQKKSIDQSASATAILAATPVTSASTSNSAGLVGSSISRSDTADELFSSLDVSGNDADASNFFNSDVINDTFPITSTDDSTSPIVALSSSPITKSMGFFKIYPEKE